jgi:hypothetical protein
VAKIIVVGEDSKKNLPLQKPPPSRHAPPNAFNIVINVIHAPGIIADTVDIARNVVQTVRDQSKNPGDICEKNGANSLSGAHFQPPTHFKKASYSRFGDESEKPEKAKY